MHACFCISLWTYAAACIFIIAITNPPLPTIGPYRPPDVVTSMTSMGAATVLNDAVTPPPPNDFSANDDDRNDETVGVIQQPQQQHDDKQLMNTRKLMSISFIFLPLSSTRINHRCCGIFHGRCLPVWIKRSRSGSIGSLSIIGKTWSGYRNWELGTSYIFLGS